MRVLIFPHSLQPCDFSLFLSIAILVGAKQRLTVILICISLVTNGVEHLFMSLSGKACASIDSGENKFKELKGLAQCKEVMELCLGLGNQRLRSTAEPN